MVAGKPPGERPCGVARRAGRWCAGLVAAALALSACGGDESGPVAVSVGSEPGRLLTELSAQATSGGVVLRWKVDEAQAHRITGFTCVYRTPGHARLGVAGSVACGGANSGAEARQRTVAGLPEYGEYLFEVTAQFQGTPVIEWPKRALQVQLEVTQDHSGPPGPAAAVTGEGPVVFGCGPGDGPGIPSPDRPWRQSQIVSAEHLFQLPAWGWQPGGDTATPPEWPEPSHLRELTAQAGVDGQAFQQAPGGDGTGAQVDGGAVAALAADDGFAAVVAHAAAVSKTLLRPGSEPDGGWELRLHTGIPFGADYTYAPRHAVAGWGDPTHPVAWAELWNRTDCPPPVLADAVHDVALALSDDAGGNRRLEHSGYGWWAVVPVGFMPERIVAAQAALAYGDPATAPQAPATYRGRASGHLFWNQQRYALAGDLTLTLERAGGTARLAGRIESVVVVPLDHDSLQPRPGPPTPWTSFVLEAGAPDSNSAWSGPASVGQPPPDPSTPALPTPEAFAGDWHASAHGPDAQEIAGRLRLWTPLAEGADPNTDWPAQAVLVAGFGATSALD